MKRPHICLECSKPTTWQMQGRSCLICLVMTVTLFHSCIGKCLQTPVLLLARVDGLDIAKQGGWSSGSMNAVYRTGKPIHALLVCGQWSKEDGLRHAYYHPRFCVEVPSQLEERVFGNIRLILKQAVAKVILLYC